MTLSQLTPNLSSSYWCCCLDDPRNLTNSNNNISLISFPVGIRDGLFPLEYHRSRRIRRRDFGVVEVRGRMNVSDVTTTTTTSSSNYSVENGQIRNGGVEIPVTCYQIIGVSNQAEKDEIVKSAMDLKNAEAEEGYTLDAVVSRQDLLMDVRDKLLFEPEYAGNVREKIQPKSSLRIPWSWVPGALCLLQEAGEEKLVLEIGRAALQHPDAKPYIHDILLSMALAECAIAKSWFEKNKVSQGFEALARAQHLLKTKASLGNMPLLSQIEESLEELAPSCALEILDIPNSPENAERRRGAIAALRELLGQGLDVELSCQVRDWPVFLSQALIKLTATEIVDLLPWDSIAVARKNKKSLESQNQRVVIDLNCFYRVMIAHIAFGFSNKQKIMIDKAKMIGDCLVASEGVELKFENALCSFLLGQGSEAEAVERLRDLEIDSVPASRYFTQEKEASNAPDVKPSLEKWLKDSVLGLFSDTRDSSPSLETYFRGEKRTLGHTKQTISIPKSYQTISRRPSIVQPNRVGSEESPPLSNSVRHSGAAVTQLAPSDMQSPLTGMKTSSGNGTTQQSVQMKRKLGSHHENIWDSWPISGYTMGRVALATVVGCLAIIAFKLLSIQIRQMRRPVQAHMIKPTTMEYNAGPAHIGGKNIARNLRNLLFTIFDKRLKQLPDDRSSQSSLSVDELFPFSSTARTRPMPVEEAENLVKQWQAIKAEALGPEYQVHILPEVLAEPMLVEWQALSDSAKDRSCFWRFVLLDMSILRADILSDGNGSEVAEIEALLEEAAELVDDSQIKNPNYYSTYKIRYVLKRQDDGSWRFCRWDVQTQT